MLVQYPQTGEGENELERRNYRGWSSLIPGSGPDCNPPNLQIKLTLSLKKIQSGPKSTTGRSQTRACDPKDSLPPVLRSCCRQRTPPVQAHDQIPWPQAATQH